MVRKEWVNLNGKWDFALTTQADHSRVAFDRKILVPFPVESALSGVGLHVDEHAHLWYRRTFQRPLGDRILLHFGASNYDTSVWINGAEIGRHRGGYDPFSFDITNRLSGDGSQEIVVGVTDPTDAGHQPRGKQVRSPEGIFYTASSGIWQTVWLEPVPKTSIHGVRLEANPNTELLHVAFGVGDGSKGFAPPDDLRYSVQVLDGVDVVAEEPLGELPDVTLKVPFPKLWSPESPFLYDVRLALKDHKGRVLDSVDSYTAFRSVSITPDRAGINRIFLNGSPYFMMGPLDQGFWPDGLYTAPTDDALKFDIEATKRLGFNMIRKHVKVEPDRWYYWCDRLGLLVWQDMPSGDGFIGPKDPDLIRTPASAADYEMELKAMIGALRNHPSIVTWIPFNEGWGQFDTARITDLVRHLDPSRLIDSTTGWSDRGVGDMIDWHVYPGPASPKPEAARVAVLGEFGGLGLPIPGHMWQEKAWGYQSFKTREELTAACVSILERLRFLVDSPGLSAAVYTQTTDVETEANGLMTYDRQVLKMDEAELHRAITDLYKPPLVLEEVVPTSEFEGQDWRYTMTKPPADWADPTFDDIHWKKGKGGFGTTSTPGAIVRTDWHSGDIWLRRTIHIEVEVEGDPLYLRLHHDDDVDVFIDGKRAFHATGYLTAYNYFRIPQPIADSLAHGVHTIAVHCHQIEGGQFVDVGIFRAH